MANAKRRWGDRIDGAYVRDVEPMHFFMPYLYPNRADNEAFIEEQIDLTALEAYLEKKNEGRTEDKYTLMHAIIAALVHTVTLRPKMNRFIQGNRIYQRDDLSVAFVVKKKFKDNSAEAMNFRKFGPETTIDTIHDMLVKDVHACRTEKLDPTTEALTWFTKLPRWMMRIVIKLIFLLNYYGKLPMMLVGNDPNHASIFVSNLGSIGLNAAYHHLSNFGTNSLFVVIGKKHLAPVFQADGSHEMHNVLNLGITLDERIADGYYYSKTIALAKHILHHPELLDERADKEVDYE